MTTKIEGGNLIITIPLDEKGKPSTSGKSILHASTNGNIVTDVHINGKPLTVAVNAYTKK